MEKIENIEDKMKKLPEIEKKISKLATRSTDNVRDISRFESKITQVNDVSFTLYEAKCICIAIKFNKMLIVGMICMTNSKENTQLGVFTVHTYVKLEHR